MKIISNYTNVEFERIKEIAENTGLTPNQLQAYATMLYCDMPRTTNMPLAQIKRTIANYINSIDTTTSFICSSPFGTTWSSMTKPDKNTASRIIKSLADNGYLNLVNKTNGLNHYRKSSSDFLNIYSSED